MLSFVFVALSFVFHQIYLLLFFHMINLERHRSHGELDLFNSQVLPLKNEMKKPRNFDKPLGVLNVGMVIVGIMFVTLGFLSYLRYGEFVQGSVTLNLNKDV